MSMMKRLRCACGWEVTASEDEAIEAVIDHGARLHNMQATREQVLARLETVPADDPPELPKRG
jgi:predicted small metal-binding protein